MQRRPFLHLLGAGVVVSTGCVGRPPSPASDSESPTASQQTPTKTPMTSTDTGRTLSIERIETFTHALRLNDLGNSPHARVPRVEELSTRERDVATTAIQRTYETTELPRWLVEFLSRTPYVQQNGRYYRLQSTLPTTRITADAVSEREVDGKVATYETYETAVTHDGRVMSGLMRIAHQEGITLTYVWPNLRDFPESYDAVHYRGQVLEFTVTVDDPGAPYTVTAERAALDVLADGPVWNASTASETVRKPLREAGATRGLYALNDPPEELIENLDDHEYVYLDGTFYTTYVEKRTPLPVSLTASVPDATLDDDGARIRLTLHNESDSEIRVFSGAPPPFGVLWFSPVDDADTKSLLWSDAYEENGHVQTDGREIVSINDIGINTPVESGKTVERTFTVEQADLSPGEYVIADDVGISMDVGDEGAFPYRVIFCIE